MIKRFDKNAGQFYMNELELIVAFILNEFLNYVAIFNAYNVEHDIIDFRRVETELLMLPMFIPVDETELQLKCDCCSDTYHSSGQKGRDGFEERRRVSLLFLDRVDCDLVTFLTDGILL